MVFFYTALLLVLLTGCTANTRVWDGDGNLLYHIKTDGQASHSLKVPEFEVNTESRAEPFFKFDINGAKVSE